MLSCMKTSTYSTDSNKCGVPTVSQFDKNLGKYAIEYKISVIKK